MRWIAPALLLLAMSTTPSWAQSAPETLAYLFFRVSVPPEVTSSKRTDIVQSTPKLMHFKQFYTGNNNEMNYEENNIKIEQKSQCEYTITGKYRFGDEIANLDTTLDFSGISATNVEAVKNKDSTGWPRYYLKMPGVKVCTLKGSFKKQDFYYQFPDIDKCSDHVFTYVTVTSPDFMRMGKAYDHFAQTYCKGRAF